MKITRVIQSTILAAVIASGCMSTTVPAPASAGDIKKFSSADEIREYITNNTQLVQGSGYSTNGMVATEVFISLMCVVMIASVVLPWFRKRSGE